MKLQYRILSLLLCCGIALPVLAQRPSSDQTKPGMLQEQWALRLRRLSADFDGVVGIAIKDLTTGSTFLLNEQEVFPQASAIKIVILLELFRQAETGQLKLTEPYLLRRGDTVPGGILHQLGDQSVTLSLRDLAVLMIVLSDNSATNVLIDRLGLPRIQQTLRELGFTQTQLRRRMIDLAAAREGRENVSTPLEMMGLLERLERGELLRPESRQDFFQILEMPKESALRRSLPVALIVADKPGSLESVRTVAALVRLPGRPYLIVVNTTYAADEKAASDLIAEVSRITYQHFHRLARSSPYGRSIFNR